MSILRFYTCSFCWNIVISKDNILIDNLLVLLITILNHILSYESPAEHYYSFDSIIGEADGGAKVTIFRNQGEIGSGSITHKLKREGKCW